MAGGPPSVVTAPQPRLALSEKTLRSPRELREDKRVSGHRRDVGQKRVA
jgi:hypothetical protein